MLKSGLFVTPTDSYTIYEIIESGFYRIDFLRAGGDFQVDVDSVVYSQVKRKNVFVFGDSSIYDTYLRVMETIESSNMKVSKETSWESGVYVVNQTSINEKMGYSIHSTSHNGNLQESTLQGMGYTIHNYVVDPVYGVKLLPMNMSSYESLTLSQDTVATAQHGIYYSLDTLKRRYNLNHIDSKDYVVATDVETARRRIKEYLENPYPFKGIDTETTGTEVHMYGDDRMVGIILGADKNTATYFPFRHEGDFNLPMDFLPEVMDAIFKTQDRGVAHNVKFDRQVFLKEGYDIRIKWDTLQLSIILNPVLGRGIHGEKNLMLQLTNNHFLELDEIFVNPKLINFAVLPPDIIHYYACPDGTGVLYLLEDFLQRLPKNQYMLAELECALTNVKADQEYYGIRVDTKRFEQQYRNCNYILDILLKAFRTLTREDGNINSPQVLTDLMYNRMHCKVLLRTKTGQASTSMAAIKKLAKVQSKTEHKVTQDLVDLEGNVIIKSEELAKSAYPALVILAKYKEYNKLKTAFYSRFERTMKTGRIFFWINQNGAATGRQSSPMHQLPPELKEVILSDADDRDFWGPDFSQIELRMIAYLADEPELCQLAMDPDNDIHRIIGSLISNKEMWAITAEERSDGKRRNFGVVYLISAMGLAAQIFGPGYTKENVAYCQKQLDDFYHRFKRIDRYIKRNGQKVQKQGYMETAWYHRKRLFPEIFDPNIEPSRKSSILRMGNNVPVQGTAADYMKLAEVNMYAYIREKGWNVIMPDGFPKVRLMLSIHDEAIISAHQSIPYEEIVEMITRCMETPVKDAPPFFVQPARMDNWGGHSDDAASMPIRLRDKLIEDYNRTKESVFHQSYFELMVPDTVKSELANSDLHFKELVSKYYMKCKLKFVSGTYVTTYTEEHLKDALMRYIQSGFTRYRIDDYLDVLNSYRQEQIESYMNDLINKYGMDYKVVGEHVRHPSLTHSLLDVYKKKIPKDMEHVDKITEAARLYIEDIKSGTISKPTEFVVDLNIVKPNATDKELYANQLEEFIELDVDGNVVFADESEEVDDPFNAYFDPDPEYIINICDNKPVYVWELGDTINFDVQELLQADVNKVLNYVFERRADNGFYKVNIIYGGKLIDSTIRVEVLDLEEANNVVLHLINSNKEALVC